MDFINRLKSLFLCSFLTLTLCSNPAYANTKTPAKDITTVGFTGKLTGATDAQAAFNIVDAFTFLTNPMTSIGDMIYGGASGFATRLAGNTTTTKKFFSQTGSGITSNAPSWETVTKSDVGLGNVENTALSTWAGSANLTTLGTISTGLWQGTAVADSYIASASTWNAKQDALTFTDSLLNSANTVTLSGDTLTPGNSKYYGTDSGGTRGFYALPTSAVWGSITGTLSNQTDLQTALDAKVPTTRTVNGHALSADVTVSKSDIGLGNVENTALSTWAGSTNLTTLGTIVTGLWHGTAIDLASYVTGNLSVNNLNGGSGATSSTFWRGDGIWATPASGGTPAGSSGQPQYNNGGAFAAISGFNWDAVTSTFLGISGTKVNWQNISQLILPSNGVQTSAVNWSSVKNQELQTAGINWNSVTWTGSLAGTGLSPTVATNANLTGPITSVGNATSVASQGIQTAGINWTSVIGNVIQRAGINWDSLYVNSAAGLNWQAPTVIPGWAADKVLTATSSGVNWQSIPAAAAGTLTGSTLASGVTASSLTSFGSSIALGTPASGTMTNVSGTAASLTAGHVTTNANLTGPITSVGNATSVASQGIQTAGINWTSIFSGELQRAGINWDSLYINSASGLNWQKASVIPGWAADRVLTATASGVNWQDPVVTPSSTNTFTNKTYSAGIAAGTWTASGTWTLPAFTIGGLVSMSANIQMGENTEIIFDQALSADGKYCGTTEVVTAGETIAFGDIVYLKAADSQWYLADADADATAGAVRIAIAVTAGTDNNPMTILTYGKIRADANFPTLTVGAPAYISNTPGDIQTAQPSGTDDVIRIVGYANTTDELFFNPSDDYFTHT